MNYHSNAQTREGHMKEQQISVVGIDLAKSVFQIHAADARGRVMMRKKLSRAKLLGCVLKLVEIG